MNVFVTNVNERVKHKELECLFRKHLAPHGIMAFSVEKFKNKPCARLTIYDMTAAYRFLSAISQLGRQIICRGRTLRCKVDEKSQPDALLLECLAKEHTERLRKAEAPITRHVRTSPPKHTFETTLLQCGMWAYRDGVLHFNSCFEDTRIGHLIQGSKGCAIILHSNSRTPVNVRVNIPYHTIESVTMGTVAGFSTVTFTLYQVPAFWEVADVDAATNQDSQTLQLESLSITGNSTSRQSQFQAARVCSPFKQYMPHFGACLVYRLTLLDPAEARFISQALNSPGLPGTINKPTSSRIYTNYQEDMETLRRRLQRKDKRGSLPFMLQFQIQRLAQNGILSPNTVLKLLPYIETMLNEFDEIALVHAMSKMTRAIEPAGPYNDGSCFEVSQLIETIRGYAARFSKAGSVFDLVKKYPHMALIHYVQVTPTATYLEGPELVIKNRVLRKFPGYMDHFLRVTMTDEDGERLQMPYGVSNDYIFQSRYRAVLESSVDVAGRSFVFLGFSHSSMRAQTVWFLNPFIFENSLMLAKVLIKGLGNFSSLRSPAKCAARIGQTFSDTRESIRVPNEVEIADIERNGRCFTDGVGKISPALLQRVWEKSARSRHQRATLLQIRYRGAKGMLALDPTLPGEQICLRSSMVKFDGSIDDNNLELCGGAYKPLPLYLNRDYVKLLEDLGVKPSAFLALQAKEVSKLEGIIQSHINAARFLEVNRIATAAWTPVLIRTLGDLGIEFQDDSFLESVLQLAALTQLRDMKYRARIFVELGWTLYGVCDETGILKENEIYVAVRDPKTDTRQVLEGFVIVSRSPSRHPGDIRVAKAVSVPSGSPLSKLHNCIVFSQHGERDLPSQLSGGDLDGDIFSVFRDPSLWPTKLATPADYPRLPALDIGREVESKDIVEFFVKFMSTDQLGRICNMHTQIADQKPLGTFDPVCLRLSEMASTAVDYSKTGIAVDLSQLPKNRVDYNSRYKPDFMADSPGVVIRDRVGLIDEDEEDEDTADPVGILEPDSTPVHYYESKKALGQLFRAIDERKFLNTMHERAKARPGRIFRRSPLTEVYDYILRTTLNIQWTHHMPLAMEIRDFYEDAMQETMCQYSMNRKYPLTELEVFCGTILGKNGGIPNARQRDSGFEMKEKWDADVQWTRNWIIHGDPDRENDMDDDDDDMSVAIGGANESLERSIACFALAVQEPGRHIRGRGPLKSFAYVAAAVCLQEVARFRGLSGLR